MVSSLSKNHNFNVHDIITLLQGYRDAPKANIKAVEVTCRSCMRLSSDLIFLCGQRGMPNSLHFLFKTVSPTFKLLEASVIGTSKYFARSFSAMLATRWVGARWICLFSSFSSLDALLFLPFTPALLGRSTLVFLQHNIDESSEASFFELCGAWLHSIDWKTAMSAILRLDF